MENTIILVRQGIKPTLLKEQSYLYSLHRFGGKPKRTQYANNARLQGYKAEQRLVLLRSWLKVTCENLGDSFALSKSRGVEKDVHK